MADVAILNFDLLRFVRPASWIFQLFKNWKNSRWRRPPSGISVVRDISVRKEQMSVTFRIVTLHLKIFLIEKFKMAASAVRNVFVVNFLGQYEYISLKCGTLIVYCSRTSTDVNAFLFRSGQDVTVTVIGNGCYGRTNMHHSSTGTTYQGTRWLLSGYNITKTILSAMSTWCVQRQNSECCCSLM